MPKCPVCGSDIPILGSLLLMRRNFYCKKCGARVKVKPSSVLLLGILGGIVTVLLGIAIASSQHKLALLLVLLIWMFLYLVLYSASAKFIIKNKERERDMTDSHKSGPPTHH